MANYRTEISEQISDLTPEECEWLELVLQNPHNLDGEELERWKEAVDLGDEPDETLETPFWREWPGVEWEFFKDNLLVRGRDGYTALGCLSELVRLFLKKFRPDEIWKATWAYTCSRPRAGAFSGGGMAVTADGIHKVDVDAALTRLEQRLDEKQEYFPVTELSRSDLDEYVDDPASLSDDEMARIADKVADRLFEMGYWTAVEQACRFYLGD